MSSSAKAGIVSLSRRIAVQPNDLGLSGGAGRRAGSGPRSTPSYARLRSLASGHVRSNPELGAGRLSVLAFAAGGTFALLKCPGTAAGVRTATPEDAPDYFSRVSLKRVSWTTLPLASVATRVPTRLSSSIQRIVDTVVTSPGPLPL